MLFCCSHVVLLKLRVRVHLGSPPRQLLSADRGEVGPRGTTVISLCIGTAGRPLICKKGNAASTWPGSGGLACPALNTHLGKGRHPD